jgi:hypothetical protein
MLFSILIGAALRPYQRFNGHLSVYGLLYSTTRINYVKKYSVRAAVHTTSVILSAS